MSQLASSSQSLPHHFTINIWAWNGSAKLAGPARVGLHPQLGLRSWQQVVSTLFEASSAGIGDKILHTAHGEPILNYEAFLSHFADEKRLHALRLGVHCLDECNDHSRAWQGPRAIVAHRAEERVFYLDIVCCARGVPFCCPQVLEDQLNRRKSIIKQFEGDSCAGTADHATLTHARALSPSKTKKATPTVGSSQFGEQKVVLFNSASSQTKRKDNPLVHRPPGVGDDSSEDGEASFHSQRDTALLNASTRLRRMSSANLLLTTGSQIVERALQMRREMLHSLRKDDTPEGALGEEEVDQLHVSISMRRESMRFGHGAQQAQNVPPTPVKLTRFAPLNRGQRADSPKRTKANVGYDVHSDGEEDSENIQMSKSEERSALSTSATRRQRHVAPSGPKSFPLGVVHNRLTEKVKIDGGPVRPGMLVTSARTGELFMVEVVDVANNSAHCRWVVRAPDPLLRPFVRCTENSLLHGIHLGDHFVKYEYHWLRRLEVARRVASIQRCCDADAPACADGPQRPQTPRSFALDTTPFEEHLDDTMMCFGHLPAETVPLEALTKHRHHASPMLQRRMQRNGGFCDDEDDDEDEGASHGEHEEPHTAVLTQLTPAEAAAVKDFEALFPSGGKRHERCALADQIKDVLPSVVTSRQVSFVTDMCVEVKLSILKPTTTFRFLMWMDLGFVLSLQLLMEQYNISCPAATVEALSPSDFTSRQPHGDAMTLFMQGHSKRGELGAVPFCMFDAGAGRAAPVEGCYAHEHGSGGIESSDGGSDVTPLRAGCFACGFQLDHTAPDADSCEKMTMIM